MIARIALRYFPRPPSPRAATVWNPGVPTSVVRRSIVPSVRSELRFTCRQGRGVVYMFLFFLDSVSPTRWTLRGVVTVF